MICPKCGHEAAGNFCSNCGTLLGRRMGDREPLIGPGKRDHPGDMSGKPYKRQNPDCFQAAEQESNTAEQEKTERRNIEAEQTGGRNREDRSAGKELKDASNRRKGGNTDRVPRSRTGKNEKSRKKARKNDRREEAAKAKSEQKLRKQLEQRLAALEEDRRRERLMRERESRNAQADPNGNPQEFHEERESLAEAVGNMAAKGVSGVIILMSRIMQLLCALFMAGMVWMTARAFWYGREGLGSIHSIAAEENYGLALYLGTAAVILLLGVIWCLWILSGKAAGGGIRMNKYDTGRGLIPFLLCMAAVYAAVPASAYIPSDPLAFWGLAKGAAAVLEAVNANHEFLAFCSTAGAILSLLRRLLRV